MIKFDCTNSTSCPWRHLSGIVAFTWGLPIWFWQRKKRTISSWDDYKLPEQWGSKKGDQTLWPKKFIPIAVSLTHEHFLLPDTETAPFFPTAPRGSFHNPPIRQRQSSRSLLELQLRALTPIAEKERQQNKTTWTLVLSPKLGWACKPSSHSSESDRLFFPTCHCLQNPPKIPPTCATGTPGLRDEGEGCMLPLINQSTWSVGVSKCSKLNCTLIILTWSLYRISLAKHFVRDKKDSVPSNESRLSYPETDGSCKQLRRRQQCRARARCGSAAMGNGEVTAVGSACSYLPFPWAHISPKAKGFQYVPMGALRSTLMLSFTTW